MRPNWTHVTCVEEICERDAELKRDNTSGSGPCVKMQFVIGAIAYLLLSSLNLANGEEKGLSEGQKICYEYSIIFEKVFERNLIIMFM